MIPSRPRWGRLQRGLEPPTSLGPQTELRDNLQLIDGDRVQLQQVLLNLIINAVEAMSALNEGPRELLISAGKAETGDVRVAVRDSGPGLAAAALERLFEVFYTTNLNGLGMGLSICRSIIEAHDGRWRARTRPAARSFNSRCLPPQCLSKFNVMRPDYRGSD
jgi:signal transduction histidine kinase